uniref:Phospholipase A2 n=1 Tax=Amphilophus citrinellus TaxID=61819 RepID=A0A3Q0RIE4_AMPCI
MAIAVVAKRLTVLSQIPIQSKLHTVAVGSDVQWCEKYEMYGCYCGQEGGGQPLDQLDRSAA